MNRQSLLAGIILLSMMLAPRVALSAPACEYEIAAGSSPLRVLTLSPAAYACMTQSDYRDIQVVNADGNPVPHYVTHPSSRKQHVDYRKQLKFNVDDIDTNRRSYSNLRRMVRLARYANNGAGYDSWVTSHNYPTTLIVENPDSRGLLNRLMLELERPGNVNVSAAVNLQFSNDLSRWTSLSKPQLLFFRNVQGDGFPRRELELGSHRKSRYIRLVVLSNIPDFAGAITAMEGTYQHVEYTEPVYAWAEATSIQMLNNGQDWQFSVPDQLPISKLRFQPDGDIVYFNGQLMSKPLPSEVPEDNAYLGLRDTNKKRLRDTLKHIVRGQKRSVESMNTGWRHVTGFEQFHFGDDTDSTTAGSLEPEPVAFSHRASRHWRIVFRQPSAAMIETRFPVVEFGWTAAMVRFMAQGPGPFRLQTGVAGDGKRGYPPAILRDRSGSFEAVALIESEQVSAPAPADANDSVEEASQGRVLGDPNTVIWIVLIVGVLVMGYMAWQLLRNMDRTADDS